jgi:predicted DNA-binding protein YlxM (UPF0122 family)
MAKDFEMGYLLDFYGEVLTPKQREMLNQYYNDDLSLSEIGENFGITRQGARDAIKHGETTLKELEAKVGFAARYRRVQEKLEELEQLVVDARFECTGPYAKLTTTEYAATLTKIAIFISITQFTSFMRTSRCTRWNSCTPYKTFIGCYFHFHGRIPSRI